MNNVESEGVEVYVLFSFNVYMENFEWWLWVLGVVFEWIFLVLMVNSEEKIWKVS